eukprot:jgi/Tetstr1/457819/TSEL_044364.t1
MGGNKGGSKGGKGGRAAAATAAHAASRKRSSAVEVSASNEARIRGLLDKLQMDVELVGESSGQGSTSSGAPSAKQLQRRLEEVYEELLRQGFQPPQVQRALEELPAAQISAESALDWLCFHLDAAELPRQFAAGQTAGGAAASGGQVRVKLRADETSRSAPAQAESASAVMVDRGPSEEELRQAEQRRREAAAEQEAAEAARRKAIIMAYAEEISDGSSGGSEPDGDEAIEDWELQMWADPREAERRRAERAHAKLPPEVRRQQVVEEWHKARQEAAAAKAAGDKSRQRAAGQLIRDLKVEMGGLGLTEADMERPAEPEPEELPAEDLFGDDDAGGVDDWEQHADAPEGGVAAGEAGAASDAEEGGSSQAAGVAAAPPAPAAERRTEPAEKKEEGGAEEEEEEEEEEEDDFGLDLFGDDSEVAEALGMSEEEMYKAVSMAGAKEEITDPWLLAQGYGAAPPAAGSGKGGKKKAGAAPAPQRQVPKALLQQHCQRLGWPAPRFEKVGFVHGDRLRYKVELQAGKPKGKWQKSQPAGAGTYMLREAEDGWGTDQPLHLILQPPYDELMRAWAENHKERVAEAAEQQQRDKEQVISMLMSQKAQAAGAGAATSTKGPSDEEGVVTGEESWEDSAGSMGAPPPSAPQMTPAQEREGRQMAEEQARWDASAEGGSWRDKRAKLPVSQIRGAVLEALAGGDAVVISGDTGCGKTTQVPQYILEAEIAAGRGSGLHVVCTQPRRIAAMSVAERVAAERGEPAPGARGARVGYHVRLDAATTAATRLTFCTTGILLRRLAGDPMLGSATHVIVDEVHERTLQGDFLMALLKQLIRKRRARGQPLKVVLMSATLDAGLFAGYFGGAPVLHAEGRTFPVTRYFLEDCYQMTNYKLEADSPAALREGDRKWDKKRLENSVGGDKARLLRSGWGDDAGDAPLNRDYDPERYAHLPDYVRRNLGRVNEQRIDFELLEELIGHIDEAFEEGAILVFLPGMGEISGMYERLSASHRFGSQRGAWVLPLHSTVSPEDQRKAFQQPPPAEFENRDRNRIENRPN